MSIDKIKKLFNLLSKVLADSFNFFIDLIRWSFLVVLIIGWTLCVFVILSTVRFLEKLPEKISRKKFLLKVKILKISEKVLTFFKK
tara:strand:- start:1458 stop:1715 length:258 start_codon:yes stop_codon:yes gene_type:complete